jgi:hypothetical protein
MDILPSSDATLQEEGMNLIDHSIALLTNRSRMQGFGGMCRGKENIFQLSNLRRPRKTTEAHGQPERKPKSQASIFEMCRSSESRPAALGFRPESTNYRRSYRTPGSPHAAKLTQAARVRRAPE